MRLEGACLTHRAGAVPVRALDAVDLEVPCGELLSIVGRSGSGKSTLLRLVAGIETPTRGRVRLFGRDLAALPENARCDLRLRRVGIVLQDHHLLPGRTVIENVAWPLEFAGRGWSEARAGAHAALDRAGVARRHASRLPWALSGGERQRVAIARAIAGRPELLLADEPTGNLDSRSGAAVIDLLASLAGERGTTVLVATHDTAIATRGERTVELLDGRVVRDVTAPRAGVAVVPLRAVR